MIPGVAALSPLALALFVLVSVVLPLLSSLLTKQHWPIEVQGILTGLLSVVTGVVTEWAKAGEGFDWQTAFKTALSSWAIAVLLGRIAIWKGSKTDAKAQGALVK